ncbi:hypothetical protein [Streptomyces erythrochromogenes]|uniref:hypothetical protein n=1 Tax=Streptomyces erythrochromogenes TaxID=285574 RepID=UPI0034012C92
MTTAGDFSEALEYFYERAGALPLSQLQALPGASHELPVSTAARIVRRQALPASRQQCIAFLTACGIGLRLLRRWADAYDRITAPRTTVRRRADEGEVLAALARPAAIPLPGLSASMICATTAAETQSSGDGQSWRNCLPSR